MKVAPINRCETGRWKADVRQSVLFYNDWFLKFAPPAFVAARKSAVAKVEAAFKKTNFLNVVTAASLAEAPASIAILRMATTPPLARDRLAGLADVPKPLMKTLEEGKLPRDATALERIVDIVNRLLDRELMPWLKNGRRPAKAESAIASAIIGDRVCGSLAAPIIRNEQERRQFRSIEAFLSKRGYTLVQAGDIADCKAMKPGTFAYRLNVLAKVARGKKVYGEWTSGRLKRSKVDKMIVKRLQKRMKTKDLFLKARSEGVQVHTGAGEQYGVIAKLSRADEVRATGSFKRDSSGTWWSQVVVSFDQNTTSKGWVSRKGTDPVWY